MDKEEIREKAGLLPREEFLKLGKGFGRTQEMLLEVAEAVSNGKRIRIAAHSTTYAHKLVKRAISLCWRVGVDPKGLLVAWTSFEDIDKARFFGPTFIDHRNSPSHERNQS